MTQRLPRSSGILLHPTSLPGRFGVGDIGPTAHAWIDTLAHARQTWWQILPVGPTGYGDSPYQSFSTFAGNLNLLSPELIDRDGLLRPEDVEGQRFPDDHVDYPRVEAFKIGLVRQAWTNYRNGWAHYLRDEFDRFGNDRRAWIDDYSLFMALKEARGGQPW